MPEENGIGWECDPLQIVLALFKVIVLIHSQVALINTISTFLTSQEKGSPSHCLGTILTLFRRNGKLHFLNKFGKKVSMQFNTTNQATAERFGQGSSELSLIDLLQNEQFKRWAKVGAPALVVAVLALGCFLLLWYSGSGWVSNQRIQHSPYSFSTSGFQFGSKTVYAKKGETIEVKVDVHEVKEGGLYVRIFRRGWGVKSYKEAAHMTVVEAEEKTLTRVADVSDWYYIEFLRQGDKTRDSAVKMLYGGFTDVLFSAEWEVY